MIEPSDVSETLLSYYAGVRMDGSNATIIGMVPGEFKADRNDIPRVWMDHGAWPLLTTQFYINQSGDWQFLLREQAYFKDSFSFRSKKLDEFWKAEQIGVSDASAWENMNTVLLEMGLLNQAVPVEEAFTNQFVE